MKYFINIIFISLVFVSCKQSTSNEKTSRAVQTIEQKSTVSNDEVKDFKEEETSLEFYNALVDKKLIPLSLLDANQKDIHKKYMIDLYAVCMCDSQSFMIDTSSSTLFIYEYCFGDMPNNDKVSKKFPIQNIEKLENTVSIKATIDKTDFVLVFEKAEQTEVYKLSLKGDFPETERIKDYSFFTFIGNQDAFSKEECDDFDG